MEGFRRPLFSCIFAKQCLCNGIVFRDECSKYSNLASLFLRYDTKMCQKVLSILFRSFSCLQNEQKRTHAPLAFSCPDMEASIFLTDLSPILSNGESLKLHFRGFAASWPWTEQNIQPAQSCISQKSFEHELKARKGTDLPPNEHEHCVCGKLQTGFAPIKIEVPN